MTRKSTFRILNAILAVLVLAGCQTSDNGPSSPTPALSPQQAAAPRQAAFATAPRTVGHTEIVDATTGHRKPADDDGDHCFKRDNSRDLVLTFTDPAVKTGTVSAYLIDLVNGPVDDPPTITKDPNDPRIATIRFSDQGAPSSNTRSSNRGRNIVHLGPGPYVEVTTVDPTSAPGANAARPPLPTADIFPYVTVNDPKSQCP